MSSEYIEFDHIYQLKHGYYDECNLKISTNGFQIKTPTGKMEEILKKDVKNLSWCQMARGFGLKIVAEDGKYIQFSTMKANDYDRLSSFLSSKLNLTLKKQDISVKGKNQGDLSVESSSFKFMVDLNTAFEIPLKDICRISTGKSEVGMEFHQNPDSSVSLMEVRLHVPNESVKSLVNQISTRADVIQATSDAILAINEASSLTPRGRYTIKVFPTFLQLHGKTYDFKIPHTSVLRMFLLRHADQKTILFVLSIDPPVRQGQTRYPFIVIQIDLKSSSNITYNITDEFSDSKFNNDVLTNSDHPIYQSLCTIISKISNKKVHSSGLYKSHINTECVQCSHKASIGLLYPLVQGFIFVHKPTLYIQYQEISCVNFARGTLSARTFDMEFELRNGQSIIFNNIEKENYNSLQDFIVSKNVKLRSSTVTSSGPKQVDGQIDPNSALKDTKPSADIDDSEEEDDDYNPQKLSSDELADEDEGSSKSSQTEESQL